MIAVFLFALGAGILTYALLLRLPRYSPRQQMIRRLGTQNARPVTGAKALRRWLEGPRRRSLLARAYPDLLHHLATQARAGADLLIALETAPPVLPDPLRAEVEALIADLRVLPLATALDRFAVRCGIPEARAFGQCLLAQPSQGLALAQVLADEEARALTMARRALRRHMRTAATCMTAAALLLVLNGLLIVFTPVLARLGW